MEQMLERGRENGERDQLQINNISISKAPISPGNPNILYVFIGSDSKKILKLEEKSAEIERVGNPEKNRYQTFHSFCRIC